MAFCWRFASLLTILLLPAMLCAHEAATDSPPVELEFSGYTFGQSPAANMVCSSGYCRSQAPGGDGRITFPFSTYETPGAVSTLSSLAIINVRYAFWEDQLYRVHFGVDCTPLDADACLDDIVKALDHEYDLLPLTSSTVDYFTQKRRNIHKEFMTDSGAFVRVRSTLKDNQLLTTFVDIVDKGVADRVGTTLSPAFKPQKIPIPDNDGKK